MGEATKKSHTADDSIDRAQRLALMAVVNYEMAVSPRISRNVLIKGIRTKTGVALSTADFNNFVRTASAQGCGAIFDYYKSAIANDDYYRKCPAHVRRAITETYGFRPNKGSVAASLINVFNKIADVSSEQSAGISRTYAGTWNVFRYSGHQGADVKEDDDPYVVRSAMGIVPFDAATEGSLAQFRVHYRPQGLVVPGQYNIVEGSIIPLRRSNNMVLVGWEKDSDSPLDMLTTKEIRQEGDPRVEEFTGLVKRRHEYGHFMVARIHCIRDSSKSLDDLTPHIGMFKQSELTARLKQEYPNFHVASLYERIGNRIANKGKASLRL